MSHANDAVVVAAERRGFALADLATSSAVFSIAADDPSTAAERVPNQPLPADPITLVLDPAEQTLVTVDASGALRLLRYPTLVQSLPTIQTAVTSAFPHAYTAPRALAPVAWSPDGRYLATADEAHATVVRRACDGSVVATLPPSTPSPDAPNENPSFSPAFIAFNRSGLALVVLGVNESSAAMLRYYELSVAAPH